jgi:hypothetical protein
MSTSGFDSPPTPSKDMSEVVEPTNNIVTLVVSHYHAQQ